MRRILLILALLAALGVAAKNDNFILRAYVTRGDTTDWVGLDSVAINISAVNDTAKIPFKLISGNTKEQFTEKNGEIRAFVTAKPGKFMLTLDREGYEPLVKEFERKYVDQTAVWIGTLRMERQRHRELNEVEVVATAIKMVMNGDTVVYNADAFNLAEGSMLESLVKQLPNASINSAGEITVNGRKINSLLINGKDFFNGDMDVAMKNLPSYTVQNIKVYDKAGENDYLTQESQKLDRDENSENLVMDVVLKKEYALGTMASIEGGYGTSKRYMGKAFVMGFTKDFRLTVFGNCNNLMDFQTGSASDGWDRWSGYGRRGGDGHVETAGLDYLYEPDKGKFKANGNATVRIETFDDLNDSRSTLFYPSGNLYRNSANVNNSKGVSVKTDHSFNYKGEVVYLYARPGFSWDRNKDTSVSRSATFNGFPEESTRNEALDSVFARMKSQRYNDILLTRLRTASRSERDNLTAKLNIGADMRFPSVAGRFNVWSAGNYNRVNYKQSSVYSQAFGGANTNSAEPVNNLKYSTNGPETGKFSGGASYSREWSDVDEKRRKSFNLNIGSSYHYTYTSKDYELFTEPLDSIDAISLLPSMALPANAFADPESTYNSVTNDHNIESTLVAYYSYESTAMVDSGFNPRFNINFRLTHKYRSNHLDYNPLGADHESVLLRTNSFSPTFSIGFGSSNKLYNTGAYLSYYTNTDQPSPDLFLRNRVSSNPLIVYAYNGHNLKNSLNHRVYLNVYRHGRAQRGDLYAYLSASFDQNQIGSASFYNPQTGVTTYMPMNINGNRNFNGYVSYYYEFGRDRQLSLGGSVNGGLVHSVDFVTTSTEFPEKSIVDTQSYGITFGSAYKFKNGSVVRLDFNPNWRISNGDREDFNTIRAGDYTAALDATVELPWKMQLMSNFRVHWSRGYDLEEMNRAQCLWNAQLTKSILKGNLSFTLKGYDLLGQLRDYSLRVNAQGRYENWSNQLGRYVMLSVTYRFNKNPKKKD